MTPNPKNVHRCKGGWRVRFCRNKQKFDQFFSDSNYGSEELSYQAAQTFHKSAQPIDVKHKHISSRTKTGLPGVYQTKDSFIATWYSNGKRMSQTFSKKKFPNALELATKATSKKSSINKINESQ